MKYNLSAKEIKALIESNLSHSFGLTPDSATDEQFYEVVSLIVRDLMNKGYKEFTQKTKKQEKKTVYYLCMEFLMGRSLKNSLFNLGLENNFQKALSDLGIKLCNLYEQEPDAGLGNGGLGRLAACFLDALATGEYPAMGYSLRYEYGIFSQKLIDGWQTELPEFWLPGGKVWLQAHPEDSVNIQFNGKLNEKWDNGFYQVAVVDTTDVTAVPYDMLVAGYGGKGITRLRLWAAESKDFNMQLFNDGEYLRAIEQNAMAETITKVLYPGDNHAEGKSLRLNQQYFLVSATIQDIIHRHLRAHSTLDNLPQLVSIHLNDTHPVLAVPELMRIIMDECGYSWDDAWEIVSKTVAYTNHTVMREALECWGEDMFCLKLPRIYQIICELNRRFCCLLSDMGVEQPQVDRMSIINGGVVRMANLAVFASYQVNGVSKLHSDILVDTVFHDFYTVFPEKFGNVTNGIATRRWLNQSNPDLSALISDLIGKEYITDASQLSKLMEFKDNSDVLKALADIKLKNKVRMANHINKISGVNIDPNSIFDVQVKRLHEYKRQLMNALNIYTDYQMLRGNSDMDFVPKTYIFGAKAAPGYYFAKQIIQFIVDLSNKINSDPKISEKLKVFFLEDYNVTKAQLLIPAAEISEQISLAGTEASGTGNMKFMINGAITLGTLDGANVEIHEVVGNDNIILFGMNAAQAENLKCNYNPYLHYQNNNVIRKAIDEIGGTKFSPIAQSLLYNDPYMVMADFADYKKAQQYASELYKNSEVWNRMSLVNIANSGIFSADRAIEEYARKIWNLKPVSNLKK
ncbi:MAG: glycogen/starch/alpha-glucan phosphorylase [Bacillota bacterium]|nr:glycogen/starch/alpha-glucan phosphorylase [Bacillota bacterium]